jgi:PAS domain S-box-containing protein
MTAETMRASPPPVPVARAARRPPGLRAHLIALVLVVLLPALAFAAAASWEALRRQDQAEEARLMDTAQALAAAVDAQIGAKVAALRVLALAARVEDEEDLAHLHAHARATADGFGTWVNLYRRDGSQILNTRLPAGATLPGPGGAAGPGGGGVAIERAFVTGQPVVSDVATGRATGQPAAFVFVPVLRDGVARAVLGMPLVPEHLSATLSGQASRGQGMIALTDSRGVFAARSRDAAQVVGLARPQRADNPPERPAVLRARRVPDGEPIRTAFHPLGTAQGWHVWVNEPEATFAQARGATVTALAGGAALALLCGLAGAAVVARRLLRPVEALVERAEAVAAGRVEAGPAPPIPPAAVAEFERLRLAVTGAEAALRRVQRIGRVGGFEIDLRSGANRRSAEYMAVQGREAAPAQESHADWVRRLHPDDRERAERRFLDAIADGAADTDYAQEYRIIAPDGAVRWIYARAEIERDAGGRALRMVGAHVDVTALKSAEAALRDSEERLRLALEAAQLGAWEVDLVTGTAARTPRALEIFGYGREEETAVYPSWRDRVHPGDRALLAEKVEEVRQGRADGYRILYRFLRKDGRWIWVESHARAAGHDPVTGLPTRLIGTSQDVTARREAEDRQAVLVHELDHRAKNTLAVVQAALRLTPRADPVAYARAVEGRVGALARAHALLARDHWRGAGLRVVAEEALSPFLGGVPAGPHADFEGPAVELSPAAVQALSMAFHELATNAAKHGALSSPGGRVTLSWAVEGPRLALRWSEEGGPTLAGPPPGRGFGSSLVTATMTRQLGGRFAATWRPGGLLWEAWLPLARLLPGHDTGAADRVASAVGAPAPDRQLPADASAA